VLAVGGTFKPIDIYLCHYLPKNGEVDGPAFHKVLSLEGHDDWVRCLSFSHILRHVPAEFPDAKEQRSELTEVLLVSCSQDKYVRLWKISKNFVGDMTNATGNEGEQKSLLDFMNM
jgi:elongator complex protein 2